MGFRGIRFAIRSINQAAKLGRVNAAFGYQGKRIGRFSPIPRTSLFRLNKNATGRGIEDDYEVDFSEECFWYVENAMRGEAANAGQKSLVEDCLNNADYRLTVPVDYREHAGEPEFESGENYLFLDTHHPEAIGLIIEKGYEVWAVKSKEITKENM